MSSLVIAEMPTADKWHAELMAAVETLKLPSTDLHAVLYTDGGCRPVPRGVGGWGLHGYIFHTAQPKTGFGLKGLIPTCRGYQPSLTGHQDPSALTVVQYVDGCGNMPPPSSNNEGEVKAMSIALRYAHELRLKSLHIIADSKYALDGLNGEVFQWARNGWRRSDGEPIKNRELWQSIHDYLLRLRDSCSVTSNWVKGHSGDLGNDRADMWSSSAINAGLNGTYMDRVQYSPSKKYWSFDNDYHPMLSENYWYFNADPLGEINGMPMYYMGNHGKDLSDFGKPKSDSLMAVVCIPTRDPVLDAIHQRQRDIDDELNAVIIGNMSVILKPSLYAQVSKNGPLFLSTAAAKADIMDTDKRCLTEEAYPTFQAYTGCDQLNMLENVLRKVVDGDVPARFRLTDITSVLYEEVAVKNKTEVKLKLSNDEVTKLELNVDYQSAKTETRTANVVLSTGIDLPKRNTLSAIASKNPRVMVVTWPEHCVFDAFRYATIILTDEGFGIWAGVYSNLRIVL